LHPCAHRQHHKQVKKRTGVLRQSAQAWWWRFRPPDGRPMWAGRVIHGPARCPRRYGARSGVGGDFPSTFPPPDARPRGTEWNKQGRRGTAETVDRLFVHVTSYCREQVGMGRDRRGDGGAVCKIAGIAYTGSNPVPATPPLTSSNAVSGRPIRSGSRVGFPSGFPPPDAVPTPPAHFALLGRTRPRSPQPAGARSGGAGGCTRAGRACRRRHGAAGRR
jgi:hypothetical protein